MKQFWYLVILMTSWSFAQNWVTDYSWFISSYGGATVSPLQADNDDLVQGGEMSFTGTTVTSANWNGASVSTELADFSLGGADTLSVTYKTNFSGGLMTLRDTNGTKHNYSLATSSNYTTVKLTQSSFTPGWGQPENIDYDVIDAFIIELGNNKSASGSLQITNISIISPSDQPEVVKPMQEVSGLDEAASLIFQLDTIFTVGSGTLNYSASSTNLSVNVSGSTLTIANNTGAPGRFCVSATATEATSGKQASNEQCFVFGDFETAGNDLYASWAPYQIGVGTMSPILASEMLAKEGAEDILDLELTCASSAYCEGGIKLDSSLAFTAAAEIKVTAKTDDDLLFILVQDAAGVLYYKQVAASGSYQDISIERDDFDPAAGQPSTIDWDNIASVFISVQGQDKDVAGTNSDGRLLLDIKSIDILEDNSKQAQTTLSIAAIGTQSILDASLIAVVTEGESSASPVLSSDSPSICTVSGTTVTFVSEGTCEIRADQAGDATYSSASAVRSFQIEDPRVDQTTLAMAVISQQDIGNGSISVLITNGESSASPVLSSDSPSICTVSGTTVTFVSEGTCDIKVNQAGDGSYFDASVTQSFIIDDPSIDPIDQIISFTQPAHALKGTNVALVATGGASGLALVYTSTTPLVCTVTGSTVSALSVGVCNINVNQAGNALYHAANQVLISFQVYQLLDDPVVLTSPGNLKVGESVTLTSVLGLSTGVAIYASLTNSVCSVSASTLTALSSGACTVIVSQAGDAFYNSSSDQTSITISVDENSPQDQNLIFPMLNDQVAGTIIALTYTIGESGNPIEIETLTPSVCIVEGSQLTTLAAGDCVIQVKQEGDDNWNDITLTRNFNVSSTESLWNVDEMTYFQSGHYHIYSIQGHLVRSVNATTAQDLESARQELSQGVYLMVNGSNIYRTIR